jgi:hypothetical protein
MVSARSKLVLTIGSLPDGPTAETASLKRELAAALTTAVGGILTRHAYASRHTLNRSRFRDDQGCLLQAKMTGAGVAAGRHRSTGFSLYASFAPVLFRQLRIQRSVRRRYATDLPRAKRNRLSPVTPAKHVPAEAFAAGPYAATRRSTCGPWPTAVCPASVAAARKYCSKKTRTALVRPPSRRSAST